MKLENLKPSKIKINDHIKRGNDYSTVKEILVAGNDWRIILTNGKIVLLTDNETLDVVRELG